VIEISARRPIVSGVSHVGDRPMKFGWAKAKIDRAAKIKKRRTVAPLREAMKMIVDVGS
jgi:hypothetical protein